MGSTESRGTGSDMTADIMAAANRIPIEEALVPTFRVVTDATDPSIQDIVVKIPLKRGD